LRFKRSEVFEIKISDELYETLDYKIISKNIRNDIKGYFDSIDRINNINGIIDIIKILETKYKNVKFKEMVCDNFSKTNYYKTYFYDIEFNQKSEELIIILFKRQRYNKYFDNVELQDFYIRGSRLYFGVYNFYNGDDDTRLIYDFSNDDNLDRLHKVLINTISGIIRNEKYPPLIKKEDAPIA
jgi:hypothetical protein